MGSIVSGDSETKKINIIMIQKLVNRLKEGLF